MRTTPSPVARGAWGEGSAGLSRQILPSFPRFIDFCSLHRRYDRVRPLPPPDHFNAAPVPQPRPNTPALLSSGIGPLPYPDDRWEDGGLDLRELWRIVLKHRGTILLVMAIVLVTVAAATLIRHPEYRATAILEVAARTGGPIRFQNVQTEHPYQWTFLETQVELIKSRAVAEAVVERLDLGQYPAMNGELRQRDLMSGLRQVLSLLLQPLRALFRGDAVADTDGAAVDQAGEEQVAQERQLRSLAGRVRGGTTVTPIRNSNLISISFESLDPELAARVANAIAAEYIALTARKQNEMTSGAEAYLRDEIAQLQAQLETAERDLFAFAREHQLVDLEDRSNIIASRLTDLNAQLTSVRAERIAAESLYHQLAEAPLDSLPTVLQDARITSLRSELSTLRAERARLSQTYTDEYSRMQQLRRQIDETTQTLQQELGNLVASLEVNYRRLRDHEGRLLKEVDQQKDDLLALQDRGVQYSILKRESETTREMYQSLLSRLKELGVAGGLDRDYASVIDEALVPGGAFAPRLNRNLAIALVLGLMGGVGLALLLNLIDNTVRDPEEVEHLVHLANLGLVPKLDQKSLSANVPVALISHLQRDKGLSEAYRSIRTSLMFATPGGAPRVLMVASASASEGKSTSVANLGIVLAQTGASVLLVDADLRKPTLHKVFRVPRGPGLTELLVGGEHPHLHPTGIDNLTLLSCGTPPPNPAELLSSPVTERVLQQLAGQFDFVLVDSPPVLGLADPIILATKVDAVMLVSAAGRVSRGALREAVKRLRAVDATLVGSVLNLIEPHSSEYGYYTRYYYNYGAVDDQADADQSLEKASA